MGDGDRNKIEALRNRTYTKLDKNHILVKLTSEESRWFEPRAGRRWRREIQESQPKTRHGYVWVDVKQVLAAAQSGSAPVPWVNARHLVPWTARSLCKHKSAILSLCRDDETNLPPIFSQNIEPATQGGEPMCPECA